MWMVPWFQMRKKLHTEIKQIPEVELKEWQINEWLACTYIHNRDFSFCYLLFRLEIDLCIAVHLPLPCFFCKKSYFSPKAYKKKWPTQKMRFPSAVAKCRFLSTASTSNHLRANTIVDQFNSQCLLNALHLIYRLNMIRKVTVSLSCHCVWFPQSGWYFHNILAGGGYVPLNFWGSHLQHLAARCPEYSQITFCPFCMHCSHPFFSSSYRIFHTYFVL